MKLHLDHSDLHTITGHGEGHAFIDKVRHDGNLIVTPTRIIPGWTTNGPDALTADDFVALAKVGSKIMLLGTGHRQRFPDPRWLRPFLDAGIAIEIMDLSAACGTYNILVHEGRDVAAALVFD